MRREIPRGTISHGILTVVGFTLAGLLIYFGHQSYEFFWPSNANLYFITPAGEPVRGRQVGNGSGKLLITDHAGRIHNVPPAWSQNGTKLNVILDNRTVPVTVKRNGTDDPDPIVVDGIGDN